MIFTKPDEDSTAMKAINGVIYQNGMHIPSLNHIIHVEIRAGT